MEWAFKYETYQDVRRNLFWYSIIPLNISGFLVFYGIIPSAHQQIILSVIQSVTSQTIFHYITGLVAFTGLAYLLTEIIKIHDRWYDKYIIKWRFRYATDYILPRLIHPFSCKINYRFHNIAEQNVGDFQERLYYPFVGDRDNKIGSNLLVRFYEEVTIYWLTQINEIMIVISLFIGLWYSWLPITGQNYQTLLWRTNTILVIFFILNRIWVSVSRENVRKATDEEIKAIHSQYMPELEGRIKKTCADYQIPYVE